LRTLSLLLLAGCAARFATVDRQPGLYGSWNEGSATLDISGSTATLGFQGRLFVFEGVTWLRGRVGEEEVDLSGEKLRIHADKERISVRDGKAATDRPLSTLPAGSRFAWQDGRLDPR